MKKFITIAALAMAVITSQQAAAHGARPKHGGVVQSVNDVTYELVQKDGKAVIYVEDHGTARSTAGASGSLTVLTGAAKSETALAPGGVNMLASAGDVAMKRGSKAIASITFKGEQPVRVRFAKK